MRMGLTGPSREVVYEPQETPAPRQEPERDGEPEREPVMPERDREPVPA